MIRLVCHQENIKQADIADLIGICPFDAIVCEDDRITVTAGCKMCGICAKKGPAGVMELVEIKMSAIDKNSWNGIGVYVDHTGGMIHPVTLELIGKARELAAVVNHPVYCVFIGHNIMDKAEELLHYGVDEVFVYDDAAFGDFRIEPFTAACEDFIRHVRPSSLLVGATVIGRSLAPRVASRFRTGLTADCTRLEMKENTDLVQIRPAYGGNIMARILCTNARPQIATVRYKIMNAPERSCEPKGKITNRRLPLSKLSSGIEILKTKQKEAQENISDAPVIIAVGRGLKSEKDLAMVNELASLLHAKIAGTRPMIEKGWVDARYQIGLSGRTVKPKLILTLGVSGSVQFAAGMNSSEYIFAINRDRNASIFNIAHYGIIGDLYEIVPRLIQELKEAGASACVN